MRFMLLGDFYSSCDGTYAQIVDPFSFASVGDKIAKMADEYSTAPPPDALALAQNELAQV